MKSAKSAAFKELEKPVTASELAYRYGLDVRGIQHLAARGIVVRLDRDKYDYVKSTQRYINTCGRRRRSGSASHRTHFEAR